MLTKKTVEKTVRSDCRGVMHAAHLVKGILHGMGAMQCITVADVIIKFSIQPSSAPAS